MQEIANTIKKCREGNEKAQRQFYDLAKGKMMGICVRYTKHSSEANDIFQDAMMKVFKNIQQTNYIDNVMGWVNRIVVNTAIDHYKKRSTAMFVDIEEAGSCEFDEGQVSIIEKMEADQVLEMLKQLPENHQIVFNLYMIEGYSHEEIAKHLSIAVSSSRVLLTRAKKKLIELLKKTELSHERICG
ncbi:MAG: RNA polymerase sigma factor [Cyclobacteriaceae bacterium]